MQRYIINISTAKDDLQKNIGDNIEDPFKNEEKLAADQKKKQRVSPSGWNEISLSVQEGMQKPYYGGLDLLQKASARM